MSRVGQLRVGAAWIGDKNRDLTAAGHLRYYDKRCRCRIPLGAEVRGKIGNNSVFRVRQYSADDVNLPGRRIQDHFKYIKYIPPPGSKLEASQAVFKSVMAEVKLLTPEQRAPYRVMAEQNFRDRHKSPANYKARDWTNYYIIERLYTIYHS